MTDINTKSEQDYMDTHEGVSPRLWDKLSEKACQMTDTFLVTYGEPKTYRDTRGLVSTVADGTFLWLLAEGYITLRKKWAITDEEAAERELKKVEAKAVPGYRRIGSEQHGGYV